MTSGERSGTERVRIALISKSDHRGGGASRVAEDLAAGLKARGHEAVHWCGRLPEARDARLIYGRAIRVAQEGLRRAGLLELVPLEMPHVLARLWAGRFDVVHFHDLGDAFSAWTVLAVASLVPTVWTLHDCSPFTGGCLYPIDCGRFTRGCGACPRLGEWPLGWLDATALSAHLKRFVHNTGSVTTIVPCTWMAEMAVASRRVRDSPVIVPNGVDTQRFRPAVDRAALRRSLGLPEERPVFLVSSMRVDEPRKGVAHALRGVAALADLFPVLVATGARPEALRMVPQHLEVRSTGYVGQRSELALWIAASDAFVCCSEAENQPLAMLEAMACGVPTVGHATGGIPETLGDCGRLVRVGDHVALVTALREVLDPIVGSSLGRLARMRAKERHGMESFVAAHVVVYRDVIARNRPKGAAKCR
jgi:glycosyltransferase involved in cell wall biosynthesis